MAPKPVVAYPVLIGKVLARRRDNLGLKQGDLARVLKITQSAYSRLESGESVMNLAQLHAVAPHLKISPTEILQIADDYAAQLRKQGVQIVPDKPSNPAAAAIGLGLLMAILLSLG